MTQDLNLLNNAKKISDVLKINCEDSVNLILKYHSDLRNNDFEVFSKAAVNLAKELKEIPLQEISTQYHRYSSFKRVLLGKWLDSEENYQRIISIADEILIQ